MFNPYRKLAKLSLNRDRLSCISCRCMKLASRSAMESASSANAGSRASMADLPPLIGLTYPAPLVPSRKDDLELGRKGVVGREEGPLWREAERCALPASMALSSPGNVFAAEMARDGDAWSKAWITVSAGECASVHVELLMVGVPNAQGPRGVADGLGGWQQVTPTTGEGPVEREDALFPESLHTCLDAISIPSAPKTRVLKIASHLQLSRPYKYAQGHLNTRSYSPLRYCFC